MLLGWSTSIRHNYTKRGAQGEHRHLGAQGSSYIWTQVRWMPRKPQKTTGTSLKQRWDAQHEPRTGRHRILDRRLELGFSTTYSSSSFPDTLEKWSKSPPRKKGGQFKKLPGLSPQSLSLPLVPLDQHTELSGSLEGTRQWWIRSKERKEGQCFHQSLWMTDQKGKKQWESLYLTLQE